MERRKYLDIETLRNTQGLLNKIYNLFSSVVLEAFIQTLGDDNIDINSHQYSGKDVIELGFSVPIFEYPIDNDVNVGNDVESYYINKNTIIENINNQSIPIDNDLKRKFGLSNYDIKVIKISNNLNIETNIDDVDPDNDEFGTIYGTISFNIKFRVTQLF